MMMMKSSKFLSWRNRNNSANISGILQPDYYQQRQSFRATTLMRENTNETSNFCYCRKLPVTDDDDDDKPRLFQHPLECHQNNHQQHRYKYCNDDDDDDESPRRSLNLRQVGCDFIEKSRNNHKFNDNHYDDDDKQYLNDLESWRQSHYFETHSVDDLLEKSKMQTIPQHDHHHHHTCIHRFKLNQRNLPVAINTDKYGLSCCIICNKPMKNFRINDDDKNPIYLDDDDNIKIQLILNDDDDYNDKQELVYPSTVNYFNNQWKRSEYSNTLALRYQKGVAWP